MEEENNKEQEKYLAWLAEPQMLIDSLKEIRDGLKETEIDHTDFPLTEGGTVRYTKNGTELIEAGSVRAIDPELADVLVVNDYFTSTGIYTVGEAVQYFQIKKSYETVLYRITFYPGKDHAEIRVITWKERGKA